MQAQRPASDAHTDIALPRTLELYKWVGSASGAGLGFILANVPGAVGGAVLGNRLGAIRDAKGKSVGQVFMNLNAGQRAEVLVSGGGGKCFEDAASQTDYIPCSLAASQKALATKVLGSLG